MKMFNIVKYRFIYIFTLCFTLFWSKSAHAGWLSDLWDSAVQYVKEKIAETLGIDISDNCKVPDFVTGESSLNARCLFCDMFKAIFNAGSVVAGKAYSAFAEELGSLLLIFIAVSLALIILKNMATMGGTDTGSLMNSILQKTFIGAVIYFIISGEYYPVINLTIVPIYDAGLGLFRTGECSVPSGILGFSENFVPGDAVTGGLPVSLGANIVCTIRELESKITSLFDLGDWAFCRGFGPDRIFIIVPNLIHITDGVLFYLCGLVLMVVYPWILTDATFQIALSFAILPFAICGYAFEGTKKYLPTVFSWILNSLIIFVFMHILLKCLNAYLQNIVLEAIENSSGDGKVLFTHPTRGIAFYGIGAVKIIFIVYIVYLYIPIIKELGENFASGAGLSAGKGIDTFLRGQLKKQGEKVGEKAFEGAKDTLKWGGKRVEGIARRGMMKFASDGRSIFGTYYKTFEDVPGGPKYLQKTKTYKRGPVREVRVLSDETSIITIKYDKNGNEISKHVEFRDSFAKNMLNSKGRIDMDALKVLQNSALGLQPAYQQLIMEQLAINMLEAKGKKVGKNFTSRNVTYHASRPNEIYIDQVDHNGRVTKVQMKIDPTTGQVALGYASKRVDNKMFRRQGVSSSQENFIQEHRRERNIKKIQNKLNGADHADGFFHSYDKVVDADGTEHYQKRLRSGWNLKNYFRTGKNVVGTVTDNSLRGVGAILDLPGGIISTTGLAIASIVSSKARQKLNDKFKRIGDEFANIPSNETRRYASDIHTGKVKDYSSKGFVKTDSATGTVAKRVAADSTVTTNLDGSRVYVDNATGTVFANEGLSGEFEVFFTNGDMEFTTNGSMGKDGVINSEVSKFKYGAHIQKGHDSILEKSSDNQVIDETGAIAGDVSENKLFFGIDNMFGQSSLNGTSNKDYLKDNIFAEGRRRKTNRVRTNFGMSFF